MTKLVIVESPTKARTIGAFLPKDYVVLASMGQFFSTRWNKSLAST